MRTEPRSMTLGDAMALVAGVALAFALIPGRLFPFAFILPPAWVMAVFVLLDLCRGLSLAVSFVVLARLATYRRMPRASEWLAILVMASILAERPELNVDGAVNWLYSAFPGLDGSSIDFGGWRWTIAGLELAAVVAGLAALGLARRRLPPWSKALALTGLATLAIAGPLGVFGLQGADLISPSGGFGPGDWSNLAWSACAMAAQVPLGLLFGVPAFVALTERFGRRPWAWTEGAGAGLSIVVAVLLSMSHNLSMITTFWVQLIHWSMGPIWLVAVLLLSRSVAFRLGPSWRRWIGELVDQPGGTGSVEAPFVTHP